MPGPGRPRKPTGLHVIDGTARKDRMLPNEPKPEPVRPSCPTWLAKEAKREWRRIAAELESLGLLTRVDRAALAAYCQCYARWVEAEAELVPFSGDGRMQLTTTTDKGNVIQHPAVGIANKAMAEMRAFLTEFGMTPAARTRINAKPREDKGAKTKDFLFGQRGASGS